MRTKQGNMVMEEICNECGESVEWGSGNFVNRIASFDDYKTQKDMGKNYPRGLFMCYHCDVEISKELSMDV